MKSVVKKSSQFTVDSLRQEKSASWKFVRVRGRIFSVNFELFRGHFIGDKDDLHRNNVTGETEKTTPAKTRKACKSFVLMWLGDKMGLRAKKGG